MNRPLLLDLFCSAGGCAMGYHRAGFNVVGVDIEPQPHFPFSFWQDDALRVLDQLALGKAWHGYRARDFAVIHASPPGQRYSIGTNCRGPRQRQLHPDLLAPVIDHLVLTGRPWIVENVPADALDYLRTYWHHLLSETPP